VTRVAPGSWQESHGKRVDMPADQLRGIVRRTGHQGTRSHIEAALDRDADRVGRIVGTALLVPLVGTLIGACLGAFAGSLLGDLWAGSPLFPSVEAGWGAAVGRF
jgi:hypothetical protein